MRILLHPPCGARTRTHLCCVKYVTTVHVVKQNALCTIVVRAQYVMWVKTHIVQRYGSCSEVKCTFYYGDKVLIFYRTDTYSHFTTEYISSFYYRTTHAHSNTETKLTCKYSEINEHFTTSDMQGGRPHLRTRWRKQKLKCDASVPGHLPAEILGISAPVN